MRLRFLVLLLLLIPALIAALAACGDDDDTNTATDPPESTESADGDDGAGDDSVDDDDGDDASGDSRGSGTITIGDQTFEVDIDTCIVDVSDSIIIGGTSSTADGQDVYVSAESLDSPHTSANVTIGVGSTGLFDVEQGDPLYLSSGYTADADFIPPDVTDPDLVVSANGETHISFTGQFSDRNDVQFNASGSVDMTCQ